MESSELQRAAQEFAAVVSEATDADLAVRVGDRTIGELLERLSDRSEALAAELGAHVPPSGCAVAPDHFYGGGHERRYRRAARLLESAAAHADAEGGEKIAELARETACTAAAVASALGLGD
ncbi:hypothetical protein GCM10009551_091140 [Nocardiopsis tropica]|uniref:hypothetical protein n=1 Tax=Tsukamurella strandjordii TaxID=147577 RepID=UPI0031CFA681